ncbi:MAG: polyphosphate kinase 2 family protein [Verrucomicrobiae bacterium]|nr:polyphosphate kinase 2 family protein [Verrucomicrobiae bacterium]
MKIHSDDFRVAPGKNVDLKKWPVQVRPFYKSKDHFKEQLAGHKEQLAAQQELLYASNQHALLLIFQAMDAAGKDGAIKHVMSGVNPQGCSVFSFKHPSATELQHDFLWRTTVCQPERGRIGIFNRSYYEEVLIVRVHPEILRAQNLPAEVADGKQFWDDRFRSIQAHEKHLYRNGTRIVKFFLHISREEQRKRFLARLADPQKNWKFSGDDLKERGHWKEYRQAYEACLAATSTAHAPWFVVPADDKQNAWLIISHIIVETLKDLKMKFPAPADARTLAALRRQLKK